jgi:uncharacterized LabA/DUF88 family protein
VGDMDRRRLLILLNNKAEEDMAIPKRVMLFIDGENLVMRYQDMIDHGYCPLPVGNGLNYYKKDIYLWSSNMPFPSISPKFMNIDIIRAYYYTSLQGDENKQKQIDEEIRGFNIGGLSNFSLSHTLFPVTFRKKRQGSKAKGVDIRLTIDMLSHSFDNNVDIVCFFSGDGDFEPVLQEVLDHGKQIFLYSFSSGFNPNLKKVCDEFFLLDDRFFDLSKPPRAELTS